MPSGRFFGFVIGGTHPAALAADWLVSAWDQNAGLRTVTPAMSAVEQVTAGWLLDLLGLPDEAAVGFVTGGTMANFTCLAAARDAVLRRAGWDVGVDGLVGSPGVRVLVGAERHDSVDLTMRYLGLGAPEVVAVDDQGRLRADALEAALGADDTGPTIVALQAGNIHSGAFDPFAEAIEIAHRHGAWVHVDGAFGLFAGASAAYRHLVAGYEAADSWATDAHKTLNVPYDCGIAVVRERADLRAAMGMHGDYLIQDEAGDPFELVPELSRRARAVPVWAVLRALGRSGVADLVDRLCARAQQFAGGIAAIPGAEVLNDVVFTQVARPSAATSTPGRRRGAARGRHGLAHRLAVARPGGPARLGEQLVDDRGRRATQPRRAAGRGGVASRPSGPVTGSGVPPVGPVTGPRYAARRATRHTGSNLSGPERKVAIDACPDCSRPTDSPRSRASSSPSSGSSSRSRSSRWRPSSSTRTSTPPTSSRA